MAHTALEISFEFFPPRSEGMKDRFLATARALAKLGPAFYSVTHGAGGSVRNATPAAVHRLTEVSGVEVVPHLAGRAGKEAEIRDLLVAYERSGVRRVVALRGDPPGGSAPGDALVDPDFPYARDLVSTIRRQTRNRFQIYVAAYPECHPECADLDTDISHLCQKIAAGADAAITQYFYNPDAYGRFLDLLRARGVEVPVIPGIMPIHDFEQIAAFSARCGAEIPRWLEKRMRGFRQPLARRDFAHDVVASLCERLISMGAPGFHFYTLNRFEPSHEVLQRAGLIRPRYSTSGSG